MTANNIRIKMLVILWHFLAQKKEILYKIKKYYVQPRFRAEKSYFQPA